MKWYDWIFSIVWDLSGWLYETYQATSDWWFPFNKISEPLYWLYYHTHGLLDHIAHFCDFMIYIEFMVAEKGIWSTIKELIRSWLPWLDDAFEFFDNLWIEVKLFFSDPVERLRYYGEYWILPWMQQHVPFVATVYQWFIDFADEIQLFFQNPVDRLQYLGKEYVLPWLTKNVSWLAEVYHWAMDYSYQIELFFQDPRKYIFETIDLDRVLIDWLKATFPWYDDFMQIWNDMLQFFINPLDFLLDRFTDWFLGGE